ncbi:methyltransferase domain-containing protein [Actinocorallia sp. B10E7]|uniref:methyltransferase n=1 Tax=Actinocorallia sp. B10E7 TaxID=3153558 RepID=UPI00325C9198
MDEGLEEDVLALAARAFAAAGMDGGGAMVVSAREGGLRRAVNVCRAHPKVAVLTGPGAGPAELGRELHPQTPRSFVVCEGLGGPDEEVTHARPAEATTRPWRDPQVVIVHDPRWRGETSGWIAAGRPGPAGWALPEERFEGSGGRVLPAEARALVLARLGPRLGDLVWDVGAGAGAVGVECARLGAAVIAVDRDEDACEVVRRNVRAHGVKLAVARGEAPEVLAYLPDPDAVFVGGGGPRVIAECARRAPRVIVSVLDGQEPAGRTREALEDGGFSAEVVRLAAFREASSSGGGLRAEEPGPVFVVSGAIR